MVDRSTMALRSSIFDLVMPIFDERGRYGLETLPTMIFEGGVCWII